MAPTLPQFNPARLRSYILRTPLFTRIIVLFVVVFWLLELQSKWNVVQWGALIPLEVGFGSMYRLNTYPLIHNGFLHAFLNIVALIPLLERFEAEHGTLPSAAMFLGPLSTLPAGLYLLIQRVILRRNTPVLGASIWVFLLLGVEAIKAYRSYPYLKHDSPTLLPLISPPLTYSSIGPYKIPVWTAPLFVVLFVTALSPYSFLLGHICSVAIGYLYGLGYLKLLAPPDKILRWIEAKLNLLGRLPHYVSIDQKTFGRYGVLPTVSTPSMAGAGEGSVPMTFLGSTQRLGP